MVDQIKETKRERTDLLAEKKELPFWNIPRKNELTARIAELTELLEELQSEKAILLDNMDCTDGKDVSKVRKKVALKNWTSRNRNTPPNWKPPLPNMPS